MRIKNKQPSHHPASPPLFRILNRQTMVLSMFSSAVLSVLLLAFLSHPISASPALKPKSTFKSHLASRPVPPNWTCNPSFYDTSDGCDCGCGATDPDCEKDHQVLFCQNSSLDPDMARCDLTINRCVPQDWTCPTTWYDSSDGCDCGCGATDPDCEKDDQALFCPNSSLNPETSICDLNRNMCVPKPPPEWTCNPSWYDTSDGCDCGCGVVDPDCHKEDQALFCPNSNLSPETAKCDLTSNKCVPQDWTCLATWYDTSDGCDCGCGATDPDCEKDDQFLYCHATGLDPLSSRCNLSTNECEASSRRPRKSSGRVRPTPPPKRGPPRNRAPENVFVPSENVPPSKPRPTSVPGPTKPLPSSK